MRVTLKDDNIRRALKVDRDRSVVCEILMAAGIGSGVVYILLNLSALPPSLTRFSGMLLYISIVALSSGLLFYLLARVRGAS